MAEVSINAAETPTEQLVREAKREAEVQDAKGRRLKLVKPSPLIQFKLVKMVGGEAAANQVYMAMVMPLIFVQQIDDALVPTPQTERELEALIERLGEEGIEAATMGVHEHFGGLDPAKLRDEVKN